MGKKVIIKVQLLLETSKVMLSVESWRDKGTETVPIAPTLVWSLVKAEIYREIL